MSWLVLASGTDSLIFIDDVTQNVPADFWILSATNIMSANLQRDISKLVGRNVICIKTVTQKNTANITKDSIRGKTWTLLDWPSQSPNLNPNETAFHLLNRRLKGVVDSYWKNGKCNQILSVIYFKTAFFCTFAHLKTGWSAIKGGMLQVNTSRCKQANKSWNSDSSYSSFDLKPKGL